MRKLTLNAAVVLILTLGCAGTFAAYGKNTSIVLANMGNDNSTVYVPCFNTDRCDDATGVR